MGILKDYFDNLYANALRGYYKIYFAKNNYSDLKFYKKFREMQYMDTTQIYEEKFKKIKRLLWFCSKYVPYYKELFEHEGINVGNIKDIETYEESIPILTKELVQKNYNKLIATKIVFKPVIKNSTGGSTGTPTNFLVDFSARTYRNAFALLNLTWCGWRPYEKIAYLWGAQKDLEMSFRHRLELRLKNNIYLNSFNMSKKKILEFFYRINKFRPKLIIGYANSLYLFAQTLRNYDLKFDNFNFSIQSSAETLFPNMRKLIEKTFGAKVFNSYGSREISALAHECKYHNGLHINEFNNHLEVVRLKKYNSSSDIDNMAYKNNEIGNIIVTSLTNYAFPFLRYDIGDVGTLDKSSRCKCGRSLRKLKNVLGRTSDFIITPSRKIIHGEYFSHLLYGQEYITKFQLIQDVINKLNINYIRNPKIPKERVEMFLRNIKNKILNEIDKDFIIEFREINYIPNLPSGKHKIIIRNIDLV